jgi:hypothetical protein
MWLFPKNNSCAAQNPFHTGACLAAESQCGFTDPGTLAAHVGVH